MKLLNVTIEMQTVVYCDDERNLENIVMSNLDQIFSDGDVDISSREIESVEDLPEVWRKSLPYVFPGVNEKEFVCEKLIQAQAQIQEKEKA
jgi:hypothetical protein